MSDIVNEQLSALLDGELPPEETALLFRRFRREPELAQRLERYRLYGDYLRGQEDNASRDLSQKIGALVAIEPELPDVRLSPADPLGWRSALSGLGVAASVAAFSVWLIHHGAMLNSRPAVVAKAAPIMSNPNQVIPRSAPLSLPAAVVAATSEMDMAPKEPVSYVTPEARGGLQAIPEAELARYVVAHSEVSTPLSSRDVLIHLVADAPSQDGR